MSPEVLITLIGGGLALLFLVNYMARRQHRALNKDYFQDKWNNVQKLCASSETWPMAIIGADNLLDEALKKRHYKGKTMGERLVSAQRGLTENDSAWHAHKLRNRLVHDTTVKLKEEDVKQALFGFRQALRDLGGL